MSRFKPGQSGNPKGKPRGTKHASTVLRESIGKNLPKLINTLQECALRGDVQAAALLLSRSLPPLRPESAARAIKLPGKTLGERSDAIVKAAMDGDIPTSTAVELMGVLAGQAKILETIELERRIAALESKE